MELKEKILEKLKEIDDPELFINIVDLGLVYEIKIDEEINIKMTLTTPACPLAPWFEEQVKEKLKEFKKEIEVKFVFEPLWSMDKMSEEAKIQLGMI